MGLQDLPKNGGPPSAACSVRGKVRGAGQLKPDSAGTRNPSLGGPPPSRATSLVTCSHCSQLFLCYWPLTKGEEIVA